MNLRVKWTLLVLILLLFGYYLLPTVRYYTMSATERSKTADPAVTKIRDNAMKLGLDLQGGAFLIYDVDLSKIPPKDRRGDEVDRAIEIIRNRIDQYGVTEPVIQKQGDTRIVVQLPGLADPARAKDLIGKTARLEFRLVKTRQEMLQGLAKMDQLVAARRAMAGGDTAMADSLAAADTTAADSLLASRNPFTSLLQQAGSDAGYAFCPDTHYDRAKRWWEEVAFDKQKDQPIVMPGGTVFLWGQQVGAGTPNSGRYLYALDAVPDLTGDRVADAQVSFGLEPSRPNAAGVSLTLDKRGGAIFTRLTGNNVGRQLAIILDNTVNSAPVIRDKIRGGRASITGLANDDEARDLAIVLRAGALPTDLILQQERSVGPSLGKDSIQEGVRAALLGTGLVVVFMCIYYQLSGFLAVLALSLNLFFLIATLGMLRGTLTLPGIAGIVLTVGMAVDANVLILERVREELRNGKTVRGAIDAGYGRALVTIIDSNLTTLISAVVLFQFGTGPIKGFATTLIIGLVANVFTAVFVTKLVYDSIMAKRPIQKLSI
jgi:SecD/SecF fusion protein